MSSFRRRLMMSSGMVGSNIMNITIINDHRLDDSDVQSRGITFYLNDSPVFSVDDIGILSYELKYNIGDTLQIKYKEGYYPMCLSTDFIIHDSDGNEQNIGTGWYEREGDKITLDKNYTSGELKQYYASSVCP